MIGYFTIIILVISIAALMILTMKFQVNPFIAMILVAIFLAFTLYIPPNRETDSITIKTISSIIGKGFGYALANVGIIIVLGSIIGNILEMSGAALKMGEVIIKIVGKYHPAIAMNILGFIVSIPVFCDSGYLILTPLRKVVAKKTGASPVALSIALSTGLYTSHALIIPTLIY